MIILHAAAATQLWPLLLNYSLLLPTCFSDKPYMLGLLLARTFPKINLELAQSYPGHPLAGVRKELLAGYWGLLMACHRAKEFLANIPSQHLKARWITPSVVLFTSPIVCVSPNWLWNHTLSLNISLLDLPFSLHIYVPEVVTNCHTHIWVYVAIRDGSSAIASNRMMVNHTHPYTQCWHETTSVCASALRNTCWGGFA